MRLFQPQTLPLETDQQKGPELGSKLKLLKQTSQLVKEKGQRVSTPDKVAILELASNFEKRKLGKQQQILTDITKRCREQEVHDLSARLTSKCDLVSTPRMTNDSAFYMSKRFSPDGLSELYADSILYAGTTVSEISPQDKSYKFFPARTKLRQQTNRARDELDLHTLDSTKLNSSQTSLRQLQSSDKIMLPENTSLSKASYGLHRRRRHLKNTKGVLKSTPASPTLLPGLNYVRLGISELGAHASALHQKPISYSSENLAISHGMASDSEISSRKYEQPMGKSFIPRHVPSMPRVPSIESIGRAIAQSYNG